MEGNNFEHNKDSALATQGKFSSLLVFNQNSHFAYIYKKTEKLVTAVYMITNFINDSEPLKFRIREKALALLNVNMLFNTVSLGERKDLLKKYQAYSIEIVSLASIAHYSGLISEMNFNVISKEFNALVSTIDSDQNKNANEETVVFDSSFFNTPTASRPAPQSNQAPARTEDRTENIDGNKNENRNENVLYKGHDQNVYKNNQNTQSVQRTTSYLPPVEKIERKETPVKDKKDKDSKNDRQSIILKLLSKKSGLNVKDFVGSIKGVSDKTIQRELLAMVASGSIKKEGERRWSTYSL